MEEYEGKMDRFLGKNFENTGWYEYGSDFLKCANTAQETVKIMKEKGGHLMNNILSVALKDRWGREITDLVSIYGMFETGILSKTGKKKKLEKYRSHYAPEPVSYGGGDDDDDSSSGWNDGLTPVKSIVSKKDASIGEKKALEIDAIKKVAEQQSQEMIGTDENAELKKIYLCWIMVINWDLKEILEGKKHLTSPMMNMETRNC